MDRIIEKKKFSTKLILRLLLIPLVFFIVYAFMSHNEGSTYRVNQSDISTYTVSLGEFEESIPINGIVEPKHSVQIDASEGGVVEEVYVENGVFVEKGTPLMKLENKALTLDFMNRETQIVEQINNLRSTRIALDQNKRQVQEQLLDQDYLFQEQKRQHGINQLLFADSVISVEEFNASSTSLHYMERKVKLLEERSETDEAYRASQLHNIDASIEMMQRNLHAIKKNLEDLIVKAPISGVLTGFDNELGETKQRGEQIARVDDTVGFRISAQVDQYFLNRINTGQAARVQLNGNSYALEVTRVLPSITNNQFEVLLRFKSEVPPTIRRGQNLSINLVLSAKQKSLLLKKGAFYTSTGGKSVFVINENGEATKRSIALGAQNITHYQILEGLQEGDEVIISSYDNYNNIEKLILETNHD